MKYASFWIEYQMFSKLHWPNHRVEQATRFLKLKQRAITSCIVFPTQTYLIGFIQRKPSLLYIKKKLSLSVVFDTLILLCWNKKRRSMVTADRVWQFSSVRTRVLQQMTILQRLFYTARSVRMFQLADWCFHRAVFTWACIPVTVSAHRDDLVSLVSKSHNVRQ